MCNLNLKPKWLRLKAKFEGENFPSHKDANIFPSQSIG